MGPWGQPQHIAHHGVDVHVGQAALAGAAPEGGTARGQEGVHAAQGVVVAVVPHCRGAEHTQSLPQPPLPISPTPKSTRG